MRRRGPDKAGDTGCWHAHDIFRHCKLSDIIHGKEKIGERDQRSAVDQNEPVLRQKGMTGVQQGGAQQCRQADALALAGKVQSMQQDGTFKQQKAVRTAMRTMQPIMAGEVKISEALLLLK